MNGKSMVKLGDVASAGLAHAQNRQVEAIRQIAEQETPKEEIRHRKGRGGQMYSYTDGPYVIRTLNEAFGWDWDFEADNEELLMNNGQPFEVKVRGRLTVRLNGQAVVKTQFGCQPIEMLSNGSAPVSIGDAYKGAATDALKKCASLLGIALDLYDSDSEVNTGRRAPAPEPVRNIKLADAQPKPTMPAEELLALNRKLGFNDAQLLKWLTQKFKVDAGLTLHSALGSLGDGELSQAIDIFREKVEQAGA